MEKLDLALRQALAAAAPDARLHVLVTTVPGAPEGSVEALLAATGFTATGRWSAIRALAGTIAAADLPRLAASALVEAIEADGEMRALGGR